MVWHMKLYKGTKLLQQHERQCTLFNLVELPTLIDLNLILLDLSQQQKRQRLGRIGA